jgi:DNA-binding transcriptional MerR regulator
MLLEWQVSHCKQTWKHGVSGSADSILKKVHDDTFAIKSPLLGVFTYFPCMDVFKSLKKSEVINEINKLLDKYYDQSLIGKIPTPKKDKRNENSTLAEIEELEKKIKRNDERMAQMYTDKLDGLITTEQFMKYREAYEKESSLSEERICLLKQKLKEITGKTDFPDTKSVLEKYRHIDTLTFEIANEFIKKIYIGKKERTKKREIRIEWKI